MRLIPSPFSRALSTLRSIAADTLGLPNVLPCALALASPALVRSTSMDRSNSAKTPHYITLLGLEKPLRETARRVEFVSGVVS